MNAAFLYLLLFTLTISRETMVQCEHVNAGIVTHLTTEVCKRERQSDKCLPAPQSGSPPQPFRLPMLIYLLYCFTTQKSTTKYGNEHEAIAVYNMMKGVQKFCPIYTLCVGNAFGEAALLLSAGSPVSLPRHRRSMIDCSQRPGSALGSVQFGSQGI